MGLLFTGIDKQMRLKFYTVQHPAPKNTHLLSVCVQSQLSKCYSQIKFYRNIYKAYNYPTVFYHTVINESAFHLPAARSFVFSFSG